MRVLGIETSCDETGVAIVEDGHKLLSNVVATSMDLHAIYGGVVPEIAARSHLEFMTPALEQVFLSSSNNRYDWDDIDAIAVTYGAGLGGSLLVGVLTARTLAIVKNKPLYAINHVEGHVYANFLTSAGALSPASLRSTEHRDNSLNDSSLQAPILSHSSKTTVSSVSRLRLDSLQSPAEVKVGNETYMLPTQQPNFPLLALIVSGGHTQLVLFYDHFKYKLLGRTQDDAIGEAFDKVAKVIGLPYPGGPSIAKAALNGDRNKYNFPKAKLGSKYDFSFSGVKTAVLRTSQEIVGKKYDFPSHEISGLLSDEQRYDLAASFEKIAIETVVDKTVMAFEQYQPKSVVIAGGVAANTELRRQLSQRLEQVLSKQNFRLSAVRGAKEEAQRAVHKGTVSEHRILATNYSAKNTGGIINFVDEQTSVANVLHYTDTKLCTDNGAMIATLGCFKAMNKQAQADPYTLDIQPNLSM